MLKIPAEIFFPTILFHAKSFFRQKFSKFRRFFLMPIFSAKIPKIPPIFFNNVFWKCHFLRFFYESGKRRYEMSCRNFFCNFYSANSFHRNFLEIHNFDVLDFTEGLDLTNESRFWTLRRAWTILLVKTIMSVSTNVVLLRKFWSVFLFSHPSVVYTLFSL